MSEKFPSRYPISFNDQTWFYEEKASFTLIHRVDISKHITNGTLNLELPWPKIYKAARRWHLNKLRNKMR